MRRRDLIALFAGAAVAWPLAARAQQPAGKLYRIGLLHVGLDHVPGSLQGLREGLSALGYDVGMGPMPQVSTLVEGKNIRLDWRNLQDEAAARETARAFVNDRVDVIVAFESQSVRAAKAATTEIPIVFLHIVDPIAEGFAESLAHPGGNLTGFGEFYAEVTAKRVEIYKELDPSLRRLLVLIGPDDPHWQLVAREVRRAATTLDLQLVERQVLSQQDIERVFASIRPGDVDGVFIGSSNLATKFPSLVLRLATERHLPLPFHRKEWVTRGALFSYGPNMPVLGREAANYIDRILKGAKPSDLPIEQPAHLELAINLKTAKALGITIPQSILARADEVIE